jgi:hypothetical protein
MIVNKRILKTGALAAATTIAFAIFAFRAAEWSKGLNSEFVVLGQTGGGGGGSSTGTSGTTAGTQLTKIVPQVVAGSFDGGLSKYSTTIEVVNTNSSAITVSGNFYSQSGSAASVAFTTNLSAASVTNGTLGSFSLGANQVLVITTSAASAGSVVWGKLLTSGTVNVSTFFDLRDGVTNVLLSRVGVAASPADMASFVIPRVRNVAAGLDVGFALVNTGTSSANLTAILKDATGATLASKVVTMPGLSHQAMFTAQLFGLSNEPGGTNYHYVVFESTSSAFAAMSLAIEGATLTSFPVDRLR